MKYQAISRDYNGTTVILQTSDSLGQVVERIKREVTSANFDNALTTDSKFKSIEAFFPVIVCTDGRESADIVYAGQVVGNNHQAYKLSANSDPQIFSLNDESNAVMFYIGKNEGRDFYLEDQKGKSVCSFDSENLLDKTCYFVKVIK